jgi:hypothetical protein
MPPTTVSAKARNAKSTARNQKTSPKRKAGKAGASATLPGVAPHKVPKPVAPVPVTEAEAFQQAAKGLDALRQQHWGALRPQSLGTLSGVEVEAVGVSGAKPYWHLLTRGLISKGF